MTYPVLLNALNQMFFNFGLADDIFKQHIRKIRILIDMRADLNFKYICNKQLLGK